MLANFVEGREVEVESAGGNVKRGDVAVPGKSSLDGDFALIKFLIA